VAKKTKAVDLSFLQGTGERTDLSEMFATSVSDLQQAIAVKLDRLADNPYQPRQVMDDANLADLAQVIHTQGFQGVLVARPHPAERGTYQLTAGHRRREAARRAGLTTLPVVVRELTDEEMAVLAITENIQREDLNPLEEGRIYLLMSQELGYTHEQIAREIGKNRGYIENRIRVARAPQDVQELVLAKPDSLRAVATLIKIKDRARRAELIAHLLRGTLTVDDLPGYIEAQAVPVTSVVRGEPAQRPPVEPAIRSQERIGNGKLVTALRNLAAYRDSLAERDSISMREYANLLQLQTLISELCDTQNVEAQNS
jgi:ParB family chromosome partitioning protein